MKTEIELYSIHKTSDKNYTVEYAVFEDGITNITMTVSRRVLLDFVIEEQLNVVNVINMDATEYEQVAMNVPAFLDDNLREVVKQYLTTNLQEAA